MSKPSRSPAVSKSRGRKSRRRSKRGFQKRSHKSLNRDGIDFFALLLGLVTSSLLLLLVANAIWGPDGRAVVSELPAEEVGPQVASLDDEQFSQFLDAARPEELELGLRYLNQLAEGDAANDVDLHRRRHRMARKLRATRPDDDLEDLVNWTLLDGLFRQHAIAKDVATQDTLQKEAKKLSGDADPRVANLARQVVAEMSVRDLDTPTKDLASHLYVLLENPDQVQRGIDLFDRALVLRHESTGHKDLAIRLIDDFLDKPKLDEFPKQRRLFEELPDTRRLLEYDMMGDWSRYDLEGYAALREKATQLLADPGIGMRLGDRMLDLANWLETRGEVGEARQIYQAITDHVDDYEKAAVASELLVAAKQGLQRCQLLGQKLSLSGTLIDGQPMPVAEFDDRVLVVVFFGFSEPNSVAALDSITAQVADMKERALRLLAVCVDDPGERSDLTDRLSALQQNSPEWTICRAADSGANPILEQCPTRELPRVVLVDRQHQVVAINVVPDDVDWQLRLLLELRP